MSGPRVRWRTSGVGALAGLDGEAVVLDADALPVAACLRALQERSGLEVVAFGGAPRHQGRRTYSVRLASPDERTAECLLEIEPIHDERQGGVTDDFESVAVPA